MNNVLVILAHPAFQESKVNKQLINALKERQRITIHDLYQNYPNQKIDIKREQELLLSHNIIIWQHPFYWYSAPSLLKQWIDEVLDRGFAYGSGGDALSGKIVLNALSAGGERKNYSVGGRNNFTIRQLLAPFQQTANLCKMKYYPPFVIHGVRLLTPEDLEKQQEHFVNIVSALRDGTLDKDKITNEYIND